eukprot:CAMPEP_0168165246 /NCGR_PEP_ID=MMETSP0139_2-20121125/1384_1 /TAXON_ID=44445 /ORGANISM="Pseudo-nitzschia australis, Strain 10249 10 AB" /LENGTH=194 /DNA_ID=CAMNT_0008082349 /DNA_START=161 /DNA_END=742 /DNA_ORIENTATION=-
MISSSFLVAALSFAFLDSIALARPMLRNGKGKENEYLQLQTVENLSDLNLDGDFSMKLSSDVPNLAPSDSPTQTDVPSLYPSGPPTQISIPSVEDTSVISGVPSFSLRPTLTENTIDSALPTTKISSEIPTEDIAISETPTTLQDTEHPSENPSESVSESPSEIFSESSSTFPSESPSKSPNEIPSEMPIEIPR